MPILLFVLLATIIFASVMYVTRPSRAETALEQRLANIDRSSSVPTGVDPDILKHEVMSDLPILDTILQKVKIATDLNVLIKQANSSWTVGVLLLGTLVAFAAAGLVAIWCFHNWAFALGIALVAAVGPYIYLVVKRQSRLRQFAAVLPEAIDLMARALRAGHAVTAAIEMVSREIQSPVGPEFRRVYEEQNFGLPLREALLNLAKRVPVPDLQFLVTAMLVQKETGGNLAEILDKAGFVIRERSRLLGQLKIYTAQGKLTGWILGFLPFIVFLGMYFLNPDYSRNLTGDPMGRKAIWAGLALMVAGALSIRKIVNIKV
jgi:tight adherence protein B